METQTLGLIVIGIVLIVLGLFAGNRQKISLKNAKGNIIIAKTVSNAKQYYAAKVPTEKQSGIGIRDIIPWVLSIIGLALAATGLILNYS